MSSAARRARRTLTAIAIVSLIYFGLLVVPLLFTLRGLFPGINVTVPLLLLVCVLPLVLRLLPEWKPHPFSRRLAAIAMTWLGFCFIHLNFALVGAVFGFALPATPALLPWLVAGATASLALYACINAQRIRVKRVSLSCAPERTTPLRAVQLSDLHVGSRAPALLDRAVGITNAQNPDIVFITGDLIDFRDVAANELASLRRLSAPSYFVIGNHERYVDCEAICKRLESLGVQVLRNREVRTGGLQVIGIDDAETRDQVRRGLADFSPDAESLRVLLYHRPDGLDAAAQWGVDLMLCGHTHNGQIAPFNFLVRRVFPNIQGLYRHGKTIQYVSPGTGTWGPVMRLGSRSEITVFDIVGER